MVPNLRPMLGALGSSNREVALQGPRTASMLIHVDRRPNATASGRTLSIHTLDSLFLGGAWDGETLAFGHFDVEGSELELLQGAERVLRRDRPLITVEVDLKNANFARSLLQELETLDYRVHMVRNLWAPQGLPQPDLRPGRTTSVARGHERHRARPLALVQQHRADECAVA